MTLKSIKDEIHNIKVIDLPFHSSGEDYDQLKTAINRLENIVNDYKPPTCASCKKLTTCKISNVVFAMYNAGEFGCNKHSDY